jgi:phosphoserine phosphatase RsbU/P
MTTLDELLDCDAVAGLLALASATVDGAPVGLVDTEGRLLAGRSPGPVPARVRGLVHDERTVGAVVGGEAVPAELLALLGRSLELVIDGIRDQAEQARVAQELAIGRRIQLALVPRRFPQLPGWSFAAAYEPAREVGGDLYDVFAVRGRADRVALLVGDVSGKGIPAALLMADVRALLHAAADHADGPADALRRVNTILVTERRTSLFVTAALLVVATATGVVRYATAGHEPPLVARRRGVVEPLEADGPLLGAFLGARFAEGETTLERGDTLVVYTDGITEARDERRRFYGEDRLLGVVADGCGRDADVIVDAIMRDVREFRGAAEAHDDLALLVAERRRA